MGQDVVDRAPAANRSAASRHDLRSSLMVLALLAVVYTCTATWSQPYNVDAFTNAIQARAFASGDVAVPEYADYTQDPYSGRLLWVVDSPSGPTSQYPPGVALWGSLFYLADPSQSVQPIPANIGEGPTEIELTTPSLIPAAIAALVAAVGAMAFVGLMVRDLLSFDQARAAVLALGLGTGVWSVASDKLWQHGPGAMFLAAGVWATSKNRFLLSGSAFAVAALIRPHTTLIAAGVGLMVSWRRRDLRPALMIGATSVLGLVALVLYNAVVWDRASISGGYSGTFADNLQDFTPLRTLERLVMFWIDLEVGVLVFSPVVVIALLGLVRGAKRAPDWAQGAALGGVAYLVVQFQANRLSGGEGFFGYRYPIEPLVVAAPLLAISAFTWIGDDARRQRLALAFAVLSVGIHAFGSVATQG